MIELLSLSAPVKAGINCTDAVDQALSLGCQDVAAIRHLHDNQAQLDRPAVEAIEVGPAGPLRTTGCL